MSHHDDAPEAHDLGLSHDLPTILTRRRALGMLSAAGLAAALAACGADGTTQTSTDQKSQGTPPSDSTSTSTGEGEIPEETGGPYPADGTNGVNVLTESGIVRSDIRSSFGEASGVAEGIPLTFSLTVVDVSGSDDVGSALAGAAVYAWHCNRDGHYSMYDDDIAEENYLRGVQECDEDGTVTFTSIFPACYSGRWPHIHFEVYPSVDDATSASNRMRTSQLAFPEDVCAEAYETEGYEQSVQNLSKVSLDSDNVFGDGYSLQMATVSGSPSEGYTATLRVPV
ncbi:MAG: intradiol ring-cleavage dioxygenase [Aeromicrobium sp.]|uniref:intradiol ring-cleavage dioxygenase n=1 Tax=Aeromicrobium sp. TaxID=1871063 RepID=UPI0039E53178